MFQKSSSILQVGSRAAYHDSAKSTSDVKTPRSDRLFQTHPDTALPSRREAVDFHLHAICGRDTSAVARRPRYKGKDVKAFFTRDSETLSLAEKILKNHPQEDFLRSLVLSPPSQSTAEEGSVAITFARIEDFPQHRAAYVEARGKKVLLSVGGPAAIDTAVLASLLKELRNQLDGNVYVVRDYGESNIAHSASQLHVRHGTALNADPALMGHALLLPFLVRNLFGASLEEIDDPDFRKVDIRFSSLTPKKLMIYLGNEFNGLKQVIREQLLGSMTEHDLNRMSSALSQDLLHIAETLSGVKLSSTANSDPASSISIHLDLTDRGRLATLHENEHLRRTVGLQSTPLTETEKEFFFGPQKDRIRGATRYPGDGHLLFEAQQKNVEILTEHGGMALETQITHVLFAEDPPGQARLAGALTQEGRFIYASHMHLSPGYKGAFQFADPQETVGLRDVLNKFENAWGISALPGYRITTATGCSVNAIFRKNETLSALMKQHGFPQFAVTNSHWTMIAENADHALVRITGGGNTGQETYNPAYFMNLMANTDRIFGTDALVGIVSTYGCPRSVNPAIQPSSSVRPIY